MIELDRIDKLDKKTSSFRKRILTESELRRYQQLSPRRQTEFLAGRFAGKEAFSKALGTGIGRFFSFQDLTILANEAGKPELYFKGRQIEGHISITHTKTVAAAQVLLMEVLLPTD